jgi:hypothetical protein
MTRTIEPDEIQFMIKGELWIASPVIPCGVGIVGIGPTRAKVYRPSGNEMWFFSIDGRRGDGTSSRDMGG